MLVSDREDLLKLWDNSKNSLNPKNVSMGSNKRIHLYCPKCKSSWIAIICNLARSQKITCPYCSGRKFKRGINDLETLHPSLALEWDNELNNISASDVGIGYKYKIFWRCWKCKKSWDAYCYNRINRGDSCPYCSGKRIIIGANDLFTTHSELCSDWSYDLNKNFPTSYSFGSAYKAWWECATHGSYQKAINKKVNGQNCPRCLLKVSKSEDNFYQSLSIFYNGRIVRNDRKILNGFELDFYLPEISTAIEFNGDYWHSSRGPNISNESEAFKKHESKYNKCIHDNILLLYVWEGDFINHREDVFSALKGYLNTGIIAPIFSRFNSNVG